MARLILLVLVVGVGLWLYKHSAGGLLGSRGDESSTRAPIERARQAAQKANERQAEVDRMGSEASPREAGRVHENMTPDEVRALMGAPDEIVPGTSDAGAPRETWYYKSVGKKVVFEKGIAILVQ
ncbi:MAG TPA: hypothetical protein VGS98_02445 [Thermoanaerobaculia bacterium]|jgi:hypothetical protein|nr:hypothetical protein [Thermoanaerobaculia bacterium]